MHGIDNPTGRMGMSEPLNEGQQAGSAAVAPQAPVNQGDGTERNKHTRYTQRHGAAQ